MHKKVFVFAHKWMTYIKKMLENRKYIRKTIGVYENYITFALEKYKF